MRSHLSNATALVASLALIVPAAPLSAQTAVTPEEVLQSCLDAGLTDRGAVAACIAFVEQGGTVQGFVEAQAADAAVEAAPVEEVVEEAQEADTPAVAEAVEEVAPAEAGDGTVIEGQEGDGAQALQPETAPEPVEEAATEEPVVEEPVTEEAVTEEAPAAAEETPVEVVEEAPAEEAPAAVAVEEGTPVEEPVAIDGDAMEAAEGDSAAALEEALEAELAEEAPAEEATDATAEAAPEVTEDAAPVAVTEAEPVESSEGATDSAVAAEIAAQPAPELTEEESRAAEQADAALSALDRLTTGGTVGEAVAAAAAALGASGTDATEAEASAEVEVTEETVTAEDVRSSSEDFETRAIVSDRDSGLSNREKFALGALGALAVGTLLSNRSRIVSNSGDRVVVQRESGELQVLKDDDALLRTEGDRVRTEQFTDGSTRTIVTREDGSQVITVRDASLRVLKRILVETDGTEYVLIDDTAPVEPVEVATLPPASPTVLSTRTGDDPLRDALRAELGGVDRRFTLAQVRQIPQVRALAPAFEVNAVTFDSGSAAIRPEQAGNLADLGRDLLARIRENPREVFLVEGHTDAVGDAAYNLALSDRRAESLALALNEYFGVPVENMVVQGYGEQYLKVPTQTDERANRRAVVREITGLLQTAAAN